MMLSLPCTYTSFIFMVVLDVGWMTCWCCAWESRLVKYHVGELAGWKEKAKIPMLYPAREGTL